MLEFDCDIELGKVMSPQESSPRIRLHFEAMFGIPRKAGDDKKGLILFWVQTESMGEVAAVVIALIEREPEGLGSGQES